MIGKNYKLSIGVIVGIILVSSIIGATISGLPFYGAMSKGVTKQQVLDMLSNSQNVNPYGGGAIIENKTPNQFCKENGYGNCIMVFNDFDEVYFNSKDLTCSKGINYVNRHNTLDSPVNCNTVFNEELYSTFDPRPKSATCISGGYADSDHWDSYYVRFICAKP